VSFRRDFSQLCVERRLPATTTTSTTSDVTDMTVAHGDAGHLNDDICALSNLRLSSAPSSYFDSVSCRSAVGRVVHEPAFPVRVLSNLFLGDAATSRDLACLRRHNIQYIVNVTADVDNAFDDDSSLTYMRIAITDHWSETPTSFFTTAINFIGQSVHTHSMHCCCHLSNTSKHCSLSVICQ